MRPQLCLSHCGLVGNMGRYYYKRLHRNYIPIFPTKNRMSGGGDIGIIRGVTWELFPRFSTSKSRVGSVCGL